MLWFDVSVGGVSSVWCVGVSNELWSAAVVL